MYPGQKKSGMTWASQIFLGLSVVVLVGAIVLGIMVSRDGGAGFRNLTSGGSDNPLSMKK